MTQWNVWQVVWLSARASYFSCPWSFILQSAGTASYPGVPGRYSEKTSRQLQGLLSFSPQNSHSVTSATFYWSQQVPKPPQDEGVFSNTAPPFDTRSFKILIKIFQFTMESTISALCIVTSKNYLNTLMGRWMRVNSVLLGGIPNDSKFEYRQPANGWRISGK